MPSPSRSLLGIDITQHELRVVEVGYAGGYPRVLHAGAEHLAPGVIVAGRIARPDVVAQTLLQLLTRHSITTREAVFGIAPHNIMTRTLSVPVIPDNEMRTVIMGELAYQKLIREDVGVFDFARLTPPQENVNVAPQVLVMAAENSTMAGCAEVAERANLRMVAAEPVLLALIRAALAQAPDSAPALYISVSDGPIEAAIVDGGLLRLYRRLDIGSTELMRPGPPPSGTDEPPAPFSPDEQWSLAETPTAKPRPAPSTTPIDLGKPSAAPPFPSTLESTPDPAEQRHVDAAAVQMLATELSRSVEYYYREYPDANPITRAVLTANAPAMEPLARWLAPALGMPVTLAAPPVADAGSAAPALDGREGLRYLGAAGLALRELSGPLVSLPRFDLASRQRAQTVVAAVRRKMSVALAASIAIVLIGLILAFVIGTRANGVEHELYHETEDLTMLKNSQQALLTTFERNQSELTMLKRQGSPFPRLMDAVAAGVAPNAGLTDVSLDPSGRMQIGGEAADERAVISTLEGIKASPYFINTSLDSFDSSATAGTQARLVKFQISSQWAGAAPFAAPLAGTP